MIGSDELHNRLDIPVHVQSLGLSPQPRTFSLSSIAISSLSKIEILVSDTYVHLVPTIQQETTNPEIGKLRSILSFVAGVCPRIEDMQLLPTYRDLSCS